MHRILILILSLPLAVWAQPAHGQESVDGRDYFATSSSPARRAGRGGRLVAPPRRRNYFELFVGLGGGVQRSKHVDRFIPALGAKIGAGGFWSREVGTRIGAYAYGVNTDVAATFSMEGIFVDIPYYPKHGTFDPFVSFGAEYTRTGNPVNDNRAGTVSGRVGAGFDFFLFEMPGGGVFLSCNDTLVAVGLDATYRLTPSRISESDGIFLQHTVVAHLVIKSVQVN